MQLYSTNNPNTLVSLKEAVLRSLPRDGGLYMPSETKSLPADFVSNMNSLSFPDLSYRIAQHLIGDSIAESDLQEIIQASITFPAPVIPITDRISSLELFHGPSLAFKDFGARFMAQLMSHYSQGSEQKLTILVATSGDTGGAVAAGFHNTPGIEVIILYPSGRVSNLQEKQLTTLGGNIHACEIDGSFDDCQRLVKEAFLDEALVGKYLLSSANSINIARLIPQTFYYFEAFKQCGADTLTVSIPSGNFGNLTAGLIAKKIGLPISRFLAATNENRVVPEYLETGVFTPKTSISTISNAMDVGNPSNFSRMLVLYGSTWNDMATDVHGFSFTDADTVGAMARIAEQYDYITDPHGAIGFLAAEDHLLSHPSDRVVFFETAHPAKFLDVVEQAVGKPIDIPKRLATLASRTKHATGLGIAYSAFRDFLLSR